MAAAGPTDAAGVGRARRTSAVGGAGVATTATTTAAASTESNVGNHLDGRRPSQLDDGLCRSCACHRRGDNRLDGAGADQKEPLHHERKTDGHHRRRDRWADSRAFLALLSLVHTGRGLWELVKDRLH